ALGDAMPIEIIMYVLAYMITDMDIAICLRVCTTWWQILHRLHRSRRGKYPTLRYAAASAAGTGCLHVLEWLLANHTLSRSSAWLGAAKGGRVDVTEWLHHDRICRSNNIYTRKAAAHGHLEMLRW